MTTTSTAAANDAAAACQRLRSHLAYLKLPAALEALPAILDAARDGTLTTLEAIEQLIGTEVGAAARRKLTSRLQWAALPAPWRLEDYDFSAQPGADEHLIRDLATLRFIGEAANILFIGSGSLYGKRPDGAGGQQPSAQVTGLANGWIPIKSTRASLSGHQEWARRCCRWRWPGPRAKPGTRCCSPPART